MLNPLIIEEESVVNDDPSLEGETPVLIDTFKPGITRPSTPVNMLLHDNFSSHSIIGNQLPSDDMNHHLFTEQTPASNHDGNTRPPLQGMKDSTLNLNQIKYYYTNIDQLTDIKMNELKHIIQSENPDIIGVSEVLTKKNSTINMAELNINNYDCFCDIPTMRRGTVLYFKKSMNARKYNELDSFNFVESVWATFNSHNKERVLIGCMYRSGSSSEENFNNMRNLLSSNKISQFDKVYIAGDFNFPEINWELPDEEHPMVKLLNDNFLIQHVSHPTRYRSGQTSNVLDLVLSNEDDDIQSIGYCNPIDRSDHILIKILTNISINENIQKPRIIYDYNKADFKEFSNFINSQDWSTLQAESFENCYLTIKNLLLQGKEKFVPKIEIKQNNTKPLWMNSTIKKSVKKKYLLFKRYLDSKNKTHYNDYVQARNDTSKQIKHAKRSYEQNIANNSKKNSKAFWRYINSVKKSKPGIASLRKDDNSYTINDKEKAEALDKLFSSVFTRENLANIPNIKEGEHSKGVFISNIYITEKAVMTKLKELNPSKSPGEDGIHPRILKELHKVLAKPLTILFNRSIQENQIPEEWKSAQVTAIFKKGEKSDPNNYRPVSLTPILCKILESFIRDEIQNYMEELKLYTKCQHGFRRKKSCVTQLLEVIEDFTSFIEEKQTFDTIYLDFKKAFDSVPHVRLIKKLEAYGITGTLSKWVENFLQNRTQKVKVGEETSNISKVISGIPQGSILGPTLFTIFINDLPNGIESLCKIFADDTKIYNSSTNHSKVQEDLDKVFEWSQTWQLPFNTSKCKCLHYGKKNPHHQYFLNNIPIQNCTEEKDLGVTFDNTLKFKIHMNNIITKANQMLGLIRRYFKNLDSKSLINIYKSQVRTNLEYGQSVWSPYQVGDRKALENVQRRLTKLLPNLKNLTYKERLRILHLPSLKYRRIRGDLIQVYNIVTGKDEDDYFHHFFKLNPNSTRGHDLKLCVPQANTELRLNVFSRRTINIWNNLDYNTVHAKDVEEFKIRFDNSMKHIEYDYDE